MMSSRRKTSVKVNYNRSKRTKDKQVVPIAGRITGNTATPLSAWTNFLNVLTPKIQCPMTIKGIRWSLNVNIPPLADAVQTNAYFRWYLLNLKGTETFPKIEGPKPNIDIVTQNFTKVVANDAVAPPADAAYIMKPEEKIIVFGDGILNAPAGPADVNNTNPCLHWEGTTKGMRKLLIGDCFAFVIQVLCPAAASNANPIVIDVLGTVQFVQLT